MSSLIIVDDEPMFLKFAQKCISSCFPDIEICGCFADGQEAIDFLADHSVDIVLTDIEMPNMNGLQLIESIYYMFPQCVVIVISSFSNFEYAKHAIRYDVSNYLLKPLNIQELIPCMQKALALSITRKTMHSQALNLINEKTEVFYSNLLLGEFTSKKNLQNQFEKLNFPFCIEESAGILFRFSLNDSMNWNRKFNVDTLIQTFKNILSLTLENHTCYFARKNGSHFEYIVIGADCTDENISTMVQQIQNTLLLSVKANIQTRFDSLLYFISKNIQTAEKPDAANTEKDKNKLITNAIKYMEKHYSENISREDVARSVFLSPAHFGLLFKEATKCSFIDYLTQIRMREAIKLLSTPMKINDIAKEVGYSSRNRFIANFRAHTAFTPTEYRQKVLCMGGISDETEAE